MLYNILPPRRAIKVVRGVWEVKPSQVLPPKHNPKPQNKKRKIKKTPGRYPEKVVHRSH
jgi:hypothetical protein